MSFYDLIPSLIRPAFNQIRAVFRFLFFVGLVLCFFATAIVFKLITRNPIKQRQRLVQNANFYSKQILDSLGINNGIVIITSAFHVPRTNYIAKKHGIKNSLIFPCNYIETNSYLSFSDYFLPNMKTMNDWAFLIKEWVGLGVYWIKG